MMGKWGNVGQNGSLHQLSKNTIISLVNISYHSAFRRYGAVIKREMDIQYMNEWSFSQTPGVSTLSEITLFPFLDFLTKYYPSHLVKRYRIVKRHSEK